MVVPNLWTRSLVLAAVSVAMVGAVAPTANASGSFRNNNAEFRTYDNGRYVGDVDTFIQCVRTSATYHARVWGPGFSYNTGAAHRDRQNVCRTVGIGRIRVDRVLPQGSQLCMELWRHTGGGYVSEGLPCATIKAN